LFKEKEAVLVHKENLNWSEIYDVYGVMAEDVMNMNTPKTIVADLDPQVIARNWDKIRKIIKSVPDYDNIYRALLGSCSPTSAQEIGVKPELMAEAWKYHPYMRSRLSLLCLSTMFEI
jgi:hypothetical protein